MLTYIYVLPTVIQCKCGKTFNIQINITFQYALFLAQTTVSPTLKRKFCIRKLSNLYVNIYLQLMFSCYFNNECDIFLLKCLPFIPLLKLQVARKRFKIWGI